jgi:hypothetical protein
MMQEFIGTTKNAPAGAFFYSASSGLMYRRNLCNK